MLTCPIIYNLCNLFLSWVSKFLSVFECFKLINVHEANDCFPFVGGHSGMIVYSLNKHGYEAKK